MTGTFVVATSGAVSGPRRTPGARDRGRPLLSAIIICDERRSVRQGLTRVLSAVPGIHRVDCVAHGEELLARYACQAVDVVLVGSQRAVPTGLAAAARLVATHPRAKVVVFGAPDDRDSIAATFTGGAVGFVRWDASSLEVVAAVAFALAGSGAPASAPGDRLDLSDRELQVLRGMGQGKSNGQIGRELYVAEETVKTHARRLFRKLGVRDRAAAVARGFRAGLVG